ASFGITTVLNFLPGLLAPLGILAGLAVNFALWLWAMKVLTNRDVGWKALVPGAVFGAMGFEIRKAVGSIYVPRLVASSQPLYGTLGIVFAARRARASGRFTASTSASASSSTSSGGTNHPSARAASVLIMVGKPPLVVARTGRPVAIASSGVCGYESFTDGITSTSACAR